MKILESVGYAYYLHSPLELHYMLFLERIIEDHELVKDVISLWPKKGNTSRLVLKEMKDKHQMWTSSMVSHALQAGSSI